MFQLPPNVPQSDRHWKGKRMPGTDLDFSDGETAMDLIASMRTKQGLQYDTNNPAGPLLRQPVQYPEPPITTDPDSDRSPLRYVESYRKNESQAAPTPLSLNGNPDPSKVSLEILVSPL